MKKYLPLFLCLLIVCQDLFAGNPVMLVRCRGNNNFQLTEGEACPPGDGYMEYMGHCYILSDDGVICPDITEFDLTVVTVDIEGNMYDLCVPVCSTFLCDVEYDEAPPCSGDPYWNFELYQCECETEYEQTGPLAVAPTKKCSYPATPAEFNCFAGELDITVDPINCNSSDPNEMIKITIKPLGGTFAADDVLTVDDLKNCNLIGANNAYVELFSFYDADPSNRAAFEVDPAGCVIIEFTRIDPAVESVIALRNTSADIVIPPCATDPCSCNNPNETDVNGNVTLWYDELTIPGAVGTIITLVQDNSPGGFLDTMTKAAFANPMLGTIDGSGELKIPFFRMPGVKTDIDYSESPPGANIRIANFQSECTLSTDACNVRKPIPTLGQWGLISLSLLLMIFGAIMLGQGNNKIDLIPVKIKGKE